MELIKETFWNTKKAKLEALILVVAFVLMAIFVPNMSDSYLPLFIAWVMMYCILSMSWNFFSGKTGYISLATAAFYGIGMYLQALLGRMLPLPVVMLIGAIVTFAIGFGIGVVTLKLRGIYFTIFTFGLALFLNKFVHWYESIFVRTKGRMVKPYGNDVIFYAVLAVLAITIVAILLMNKSRFGLALNCIGQNEDSAQHVGVDTTLIKVLGFAFTAAPVGAVGVVMSSAITYVDPDIAFRLLASFFPVLMAIFGGMKSTYGPLVGAAVFYILQDYLLRTTGYYMIIFGAIMIAIVLLMPQGIFGLIAQAIAKHKRGYNGEVIGDVK